MPQVEVTLDVDGNGVLSVKPRDGATGNAEPIRIEASGGAGAGDEAAEGKDEGVIDAEYEVKDTK